KGTHSHNDNLGFELCFGGITYIADPGTFTYLRHPELRDLFRSTAYHSTLRINDFEQNDPASADLFQLIPKSKPSIIRWDSNDREDRFQGQL
ncbi:heparinase II/III domain-containing protein, partial [Staphylococcus aureus]